MAAGPLMDDSGVPVHGAASWHAPCFFNRKSDYDRPSCTRPLNSALLDEDPVSIPVTPRVPWSPLFRHRKLDLRSRTIRVLSVDSKLSADGLIQCSLRSIPLADNHTCLSYMWGDGEAQYFIRINGLLFRVKANLWGFFNLARRNYVDRHLWIDAICINQDDSFERSHQVRLMGDIYAQSREVLVYLGSGRSDIPYAMARLRAIEVESIHGDHTADEFAHQIRIKAKTSECPPLLPLEMCEWHGLIELCKVRYWRRIWIKQEIVNAAHAQLLWGSSHCAWDSLAWILQGLFAGDSQLGRDLPGLKRRLRTSEAVPLAQLYFSRVSSNDPIRENPTTLIPKFCLSDCTDVRDRVYGLLGLTISGDQFVVDYDDSRTELFVKTLIHCKSWCHGWTHLRHRSWGRHGMHLRDLLEFGLPLSKALSLDKNGLCLDVSFDAVLTRNRSLISSLGSDTIIERGTIWSHCTASDKNRASWTTQCLTDSILSNNGNLDARYWYAKQENTSTSREYVFREGFLLIKLECEALFLVCCKDGAGIVTPVCFLTRVTPPTPDIMAEEDGDNLSGDYYERCGENVFQAFDCMGLDAVKSLRPDPRDPPSAHDVVFSIPLGVVMRLIALLQDSWPSAQAEGPRGKVVLEEDWIPKGHCCSTFVFEPVSDHMSPKS